MNSQMVPDRRVLDADARTPKVMLDWMFFTSDQEPGGAVMAMQSTKSSAQTLETWGRTDVVLHADRELTTKLLVRAIANAPVHGTLPRHGPPYSHQRQKPVQACIQFFRGIFVENKLALEARIGCRLLLKHPHDCVVDPSRYLADDQLQLWTRWVHSLQEDPWQAT